MAYIGRDISNLSDRAVLDNITTSATATYNLLLNGVAYVPISAESLTVSLNGVIQKPQSSYTVSGSTIVFDSALTSSDSIDFILAERAITLTTVGSGSVGTTQLADTAVTTAKITDDAVTNAKVNNDLISGATELTSQPADTDEFLVSDAGTLKRIDYSLIKATDGVGINQSWSDLTSSRSLSTTYTNSTGQPIMVAVSNFNPDSTSHGVKVGGSFIMKGDITSASYVTFIVPDNTTYECIGGNPSFTMWSELR